MKTSFHLVFAFLLPFCNIRLSIAQSVIGHAPTPCKELDPSPYVRQPAIVQDRVTPSSAPVPTLTAHSPVHSSTASPSIKLETTFTNVSPSPIITKSLSNGISAFATPSLNNLFSTFPDSPTAQNCPFPSPEYFGGRYRWLPRSFERQMSEKIPNNIRFQLALGVRMEKKIFFSMNVDENSWIQSAGILFFIGYRPFSYIYHNYPKISEYSKWEKKKKLYKTKLLKNVPKPMGQKCCNNQFTIYVHLQICTVGRCEVHKKQYKNKLRCKRIQYIPYA